MEKKGTYQLVDEDRETKDKDYLDFEGRKRFLAKEFCNNTSVSLADIDYLTTIFDNESELRARTDAPREGRNRIIYITYNYLGEKKLGCVYNDPILHEIASNAIGPQRGSINIYNSTTKSYLMHIYDEIRNGNSELSEIIYSRTKNSYSVNAHNKELVLELHNDKSYTERDNQYQLRRFIRSFSSYKEFRALYLNYKEFTKKKLLDNFRKEQEHKDEIKCLRYEKKNNNKQVPGQISMFDNQ